MKWLNTTMLILLTSWTLISNVFAQSIESPLSESIFVVG